VIEIAKEVAEAMGVRPHIVHLPPRNEVGRAYADHTACQSVFGEYPQTPLRQGLQRMAVWVKTVGSRKSKLFRGIEIKRGLPETWTSQRS
jgi:UDP-glucose 4-epimerase